MRKPKEQHAPEALIPIPEGLTKREYFAAMALQGMLGGADISWHHKKTEIDDLGNKRLVNSNSMNYERIMSLSTLAVNYADALRKALDDNDATAVELIPRKEYIEHLKDAGYTDKEIRKEISGF